MDKNDFGEAVGGFFQELLEDALSEIKYEQKKILERLKKLENRAYSHCVIKKLNPGDNGKEFVVYEGSYEDCFVYYVKCHHSMMMWAKNKEKCIKTYGKNRYRIEPKAKPEPTHMLRYQYSKEWPDIKMMGSLKQCQKEKKRKLAKGYDDKNHWIEVISEYEK